MLTMVRTYMNAFGNRCQLTLISDYDIAIIPRNRYLDRLVTKKHNGMKKIVTSLQSL